MKKRDKHPSGVQWTIPGQLATAAGPTLSVRERVQQDVDAWLSEVKSQHIRSIICLLDTPELEALYNDLPGGLLGYYENNGLHAKQVPAADYQSPPLRSRHLRHIWKAFLELPKPVLIHCRQGVSRTGHAVDFIVEMLEKSKPKTSALMIAIPFLSRLLS